MSDLTPKNENNMLNLAKETFKENKQEFIDGLFDTLKIPSISRLPEYKNDCEKCAKLLNEKLLKIGFASNVIPTSGNSVVYGEYEVSKDVPTMLVYGHYDVQPVTKNWDTEPFTPVIKEGRIYARGAQDNKGQVSYVMCAIESLIKSNNLGYNIKLILDGEEEAGSNGTKEALLKLGDKLQSDYMLVCDTESTSKDLGTVILGLRGICAFNITLTGANSGHHSGTFGGILSNPGDEISKLIASLRDKDGKVAVDGFYDKVKDLKEVPQEFIAPFDEEEIKNITGIAPTGGEKYIKNGNVRAGARPTIDTLYITCGPKDEEQISNSIPPFAKARLSVRLVDGQVPDEIVALIRKHLQKVNDTALKLEVEMVGDKGVALSIPNDGEAITRAVSVIKAVCSGNYNYAYEGGSIPIVTDLSKFSKHEPVLVGFGLKEDNIHADNESFGLDQYEKGFLFVYLFLSKEKEF